jgi:hypothetical protein
LSKSYVSVSGFSVEDIHLRCKAIGLGINALALDVGRAGAIRATVVYCATLERKAQEVDARATARIKDLFNAMSVAVETGLKCSRSFLKSRSKLEKLHPHSSYHEFCTSVMSLK